MNIHLRKRTIGRGSRNRTHTKGFGDLRSTVKLCPWDMEGGRFELPNPKERIYSPPRLATSLPLHERINKNMAEEEGFEPPRALTPLSVFKTDPFSRTWVFLRNWLLLFKLMSNRIF
jgi:hypothetical protein